MRSFAQFIHEQLELPGNIADIRDICEGTDRYSMYKVGPVLSISVSISNMMRIVFKLVHSSYMLVN